MCLLIVASRLVPDEPLIVGANRDEILDRPATAVAMLEAGPPRILGGRDELVGGTWLAVNEHGVCAGLTNQPREGARDPSKRSRGELPVDLARHDTAAGAVDAFLGAHRPEDYSGCWLLVGDRTSLFFIDFTGVTTSVAVSLPPGIHVLENRPLGATSPKVDLVLASVGSPRDGAAVAERFQRLLTDHRIPEGDERPNAANCVHLDGYGTRSSCLVRVGADPAVSPRFLVADGPPCSTPYDDAGALWPLRGRAGPAQSRTSGL